MLYRIPYYLSPTRRTRPPMGVARAPQRLWPRHRRWVRSHHCCVPHCPALAVDFAHLRSVRRDGLAQRPHDRFGVPLCRHHHLEQHDCGVDTFEDRHGVDLWAIARDLVRRSPDTRMKDALAQSPELFAPEIPVYRVASR